MNVNNLSSDILNAIWNKAENRYLEVIPSEKKPFCVEHFDLLYFDKDGVECSRQAFYSAKTGLVFCVQLSRFFEVDTKEEVLTQSWKVISICQYDAENEQFKHFDYRTNINKSQFAWQLW